MATTAHSNYLPIAANPELLERLASVLHSLWGPELRIGVTHEYEDGGRDSVTIAQDALSTLLPIAPPIKLFSIRAPGSGGPDMTVVVYEEFVTVLASADTMTQANAIKAAVVEHWSLSREVTTITVASPRWNAGSMQCNAFRKTT